MIRIFFLEGKGREGRGREGKGREGKGREGKGRGGRGGERMGGVINPFKTWSTEISSGLGDTLYSMLVSHGLQKNFQDWGIIY